MYMIIAERGIYEHLYSTEKANGLANIDVKDPSSLSSVWEAFLVYVLLPLIHYFLQRCSGDLVASRVPQLPCKTMM